MTLFKFKYNVQESIKLFAAGILFSCIFIILALYQQQGLWLLGFAFSLLILSLIGLSFAAAGLVMVIKFKENDCHITQDEYIAKMFGVEGTSISFVALIPLIYLLTDLIFIKYGINCFDLLPFNFLGNIIQIILALDFLYLCYRNALELSLIVFSVILFHHILKKSRG